MYFMNILSRIFTAKDDDMINISNLIIGSSRSGKTYNWFIEREKLKSFANSVYDRVSAEVYYVDLSEKENKFTGLYPEIHIYRNVTEFVVLLGVIKEKINERIKLYSEGQSLEDLPAIYLIVYEKDKLSEELSHALQALMHYIVEKQRIVKLVFVLHDSF